MNDEQCARLIAATDRLKEAQADVKEICVEIAAGGEPTDVRKVVAARGRTSADRADSGNRGTAKGRTGGLRSSLPGKKQYCRKVKCVECGTVTGSRLLEGRSLPLNHRDPRSHNPCKGIDKPGELVTKAAGESTVA